MTELGAGLILAIGGAGLLAALAFRYLADTVIRLNQELQRGFEDRQSREAERESLRTKIEDLETKLDTCQETLQVLQKTRGEVMGTDGPLSTMG